MYIYIIIFAAIVVVALVIATIVQPASFWGWVGLTGIVETCLLGASGTTDGQKLVWLVWLGAAIVSGILSHDVRAAAKAPRNGGSGTSGTATTSSGTTAPPNETRAEKFARLISEGVAAGLSRDEALEFAGKELDHKPTPIYSGGTEIIAKKVTRWLGIPIPFTKVTFNTKSGLLKYEHPSLEAVFLKIGAHNSYMTQYSDFGSLESVGIGSSGFLFNTSLLHPEIGVKKKIRMHGEVVEVYVAYGYDNTIIAAMQWWWENFGPKK